jgi:hypothetical protein
LKDKNKTFGTARALEAEVDAMYEGTEELIRESFLRAEGMVKGLFAFLKGFFLLASVL